MKRRFLPIFAVLFIALGVVVDRVLSAGTASPATAAPAATTAAPDPILTSASMSALDQATVQAYAIASPSVVYVVSQGVGSGSGVIYDANGDIVTNNHVVAGATRLTVTLNNGKTYKATLVGTDQADDLAVIRIHASGLTPAHFAAAGGYQIAQTVLAIGSPLGLKQSVTSGLISGLNRVEQEPNGAYIANAVQTSAPINPGNSGGALVTLGGAVVGIPTLEQTSAQDGTSAQDIGFAVPSQRVTLIANQIIASGKVTHTGRAFLGIAPTDAANQGGSSFFGGIGSGPPAPTTSGALVSQVAPNGPAARAGIQPGDIITSANGTPVTDAQDLLTVLAGEKPGSRITLKVDRNGTTNTIQIQLGELPA